MVVVVVVVQAVIVAISSSNNRNNSSSIYSKSIDKSHATIEVTVVLVAIAITLAAIAATGAELVVAVAVVQGVAVVVGPQVVVTDIACIRKGHAKSCIFHTRHISSSSELHTAIRDHLKRNTEHISTKPKNSVQASIHRART